MIARGIARIRRLVQPLATAGMARRGAAMTLAVLAARGACAAPDRPPPQAADTGKPLWEAAIGLFPSTFPAYRGSSAQQYYLLPFPFLIYRGKVFKADRHGLRALLFDSPRLELNVSTNAAIPVNSSKESRRDGMPDLDTTVEIGPSLNILLAATPGRDRLQLNLPARLVVATDFSSFETLGWVFNPHLNFDSPSLVHGWDTGFDLGPLFATRDYHDYYYRVKPAYVRADRPLYRPSGGYSGMVALASISRRFDRCWVGGFLRYDYLGGARFDDSPLVSTDHSLMGGVAVTWFFARSAQRVPR